LLGEDIDTSKADENLVQCILKEVHSLRQKQSLLVIAFCGESGSGKTVISKAIEKALNSSGVVTYLLQMDDYFRLPPQNTSELRQKSLEHVGPSEVDLTLLDQHIELIKLGNRDFELREMHFKDNQLCMIENDIPKDLEVLIVEGTYVCLLKQVHKTFFLERTYVDTHIHRTARLREPQTELIEQVLEKEHQIVKMFSEKSDYIITKDFKLKAHQNKNLHH